MGTGFTLLIPYDQVLLLVMALFMFVGATRGWYREFITTAVLVGLTIFLIQPELAAPIVRYLESSRFIKPLRVALPLRILGMIASPTDQPALDIEREKERVEQAIQDLRVRSLVELEWLPGQTWRDLFELFGEDERPRPPQRPRSKPEEMMGRLGLEGGLTLAELKRRYKQLAKKHHPDLHGGDRAAEERLKLINEAYTYLQEQRLYA